eukprot:CAMPEP_0113846404 /NCGR_PEP_ID=MMETSP0372-20130328/1290_1 /TAXON_ID=340204 /ORGANISM="Lankesteria abbotti" /LENGTH=308 /DNA_ID=CAMNT_0000815547 /DNA_START=63 /DNA_END=989 /DNA_ORIENTATION=- /assembly_acc=CAM_ASM_000359
MSAFQPNPEPSRMHQRALSISADKPVRGCMSRFVTATAIGVTSSLVTFAMFGSLDKRKTSPNKFVIWDDDWDSEWRSERQSEETPHTITTDIADESSSAPEWWRRLPMAARQIMLVRHGQYKNVHLDDDNVQGLTKMGEQQAHMTGKRLAQLLQDEASVTIRHSTLKRARQTAAIISSYLPSTPIVADSDLAEGVPDIPSPGTATFRPSIQEIQQDQPRIERAYKRYFFRPLPPPAGKAKVVHEVVVCHGNVIRYFLCRALQFPTTGWLRFSSFNCGITWLSVDNNGRVSSREFGNVGHLPPDHITYH